MEWAHLKDEKTELDNLSGVSGAELYILHFFPVSHWTGCYGHNEKREDLCPWKAHHAVGHRC